MNPPPGTRDEYSRGGGGSGRVPGGPRGAVAVRSGRMIGPILARRHLRGNVQPTRYPRAVSAAILIGALAAAVVLIVAEFSTLYTVHVVNHSTALRTVQAGENNSYALIPIALAAVVLGFATLAGAGRYALAALGIAAVVALLIGLLGDLPDARHTGLVRSTGGGFVNAVASPHIGMYLETLGALLLIATAGLGLLLGQPGPRQGPEG